VGGLVKPESSSERWSRIEALLGHVLDLPPEERTAHLDEVCAGDPILHQQLAALVDASEHPGRFDRASALVNEWLAHLDGPAIEAGSAIGPYIVAERIGAGGMGEVYRARDTRLGRDVAIKVLTPAAAGEERARRRLEREARTVASLSHPNIVALYDVGEFDGLLYMVTELLDGETLRETVRRGPIPEETLIEIGIQTARGLAAAHLRHVVHRDLKPENLFLTRDRTVKILDFGVAKPSVPAVEGTDTAPHAVAGTINYMSPEQIGGDPVDERSDLFSLGAVLYEAATGEPAFAGHSRTETARAILAASPPALDPARLSPGVTQIITRCLSKAPEGRYQSAADLAFTLQVLSGRSQTIRRTTTWKPRRTIRWTHAAALATAAAAATALVLSLWPDTRFSSPVSMQQLTFQNGRLGLARFAPDGDVIVYGASWDGAPFRVFTTRTGASESRVLDLPPADLLAISRRGDLAISVARPGVDGFEPDGRLAVVPLSGGAPRELYEHVVGADFGPDGELAALAVREGDVARLEFPVGTVVHRARLVLQPRVSADGQRVCFFAGRAYGTLMVAERGQPARQLAADLGRGGNCVWSADGREMWVSASNVVRPGESGGTTHATLAAIDLRGRRRAVNAFSQHVEVLDVAPDGRMLINTSTLRYAVHGSPGAGNRDMDLSAFEATRIGHLRADGQAVALWDNGAGAGRDLVFVRAMRESRPVRLGQGRPLAITPDGASIAVLHDPVDATNTFHRTVVMTPTGPGSARTLPLPVEVKQSVSNPLGREDPSTRTADFSADGGRLLIPSGRAPGRPPRLFVHDLREGWTKPITPENVTGPAVLSPDGRRVVVKEGESLIAYPVDEGARQALAGPAEPGVPVRWSADGHWIFVIEDSGAATRLVQRNVNTGTREFLREIRVPDPAGLMSLDTWVAADGRTYAYGTSRSVGALFLVEGLR
jgi:eukaryotic-like serine/threonine-protein kinase